MPAAPRTLVAVTATTDRATGPARVRLNAAYVRALEAAGLIPLLVPPLADPGAAARVVAAVAGLVLTGGEDVAPAAYGAEPHPRLGTVNAARDASELALAIAARDARLPTLAICRGVQLLNVALGGTLVQDIPSQCTAALPHDHDGGRDQRTHSVTLSDGSRLGRALGTGEAMVNSLHHQAIDRLGNGLRVTARAPDGMVEGVEWAEAAWWAVGVQWHPEELLDTAEAWDRRLFAAFANRVREP